MNKLQTVNTFEDGLIMDLNPIKAPNTSLTSSLNATILTFNSNENSLLCDMGNGRVESAYLPEGYMPLGTTSFGGIIYIVSYNPENNRCLIGSFPSPERNFTKDEVGDSITVSNEDFIQNGVITNTLIKKKLSDILLNPGDKYIVKGDHGEDSFKVDLNGFPVNYLEIKFATINSSGLLVYLNTLQVYDGYPIKIDLNNESTTSTNVDEYRELISADYNIFDSKSAGNLYVIFKLNVPTEFNVTYDVGIPYLDEYNQSTIPIMFHFELLPKDYPYFDYISVEASNEPAGSGYKNLKETLTKGVLDGEVATFTFTPVLTFGVYDKLTKTVEIDTTLINSGIVSSDIWKYYKNSSGMLINFDYSNFLFYGERTNAVKLVLIPANKCTTNMNLSALYNSEFFSFNCSSYSGSFSIDLPFNDLFEVNKLYLAAIICQIQSGDEIKYRGVYHWIYTNGMFNLNYLKLEELNFDNLSLPIEYELVANVEKPIISNKEETSDETRIYLNPYITYGETTKKIDYTKSISLTLNSNVFIHIKDSYNIFEIDLQIDGNLIIENSAINSNTIINEEIKVNDTIISAPKITCVTTKDNNKTIISITLNDSIYFNTTLKTVTVGKYYAPILETLEDYSKYGLLFDNNTFYNDVTFLALGISSGGSDSLGDGGLKLRVGMVTLGIEESTDTSSKIKLSLTEVVETSINDGNGFNRFPNGKFSTFVASSTNSAPIVPVLLTWIGGPAVAATSKENDDISKNQFLKYTDLGFRGKDTVRSNNFKSTLESKYRYLWLFMKATNGSVYLPLNDFIKITGDTSDTSAAYFEACLYKYACVLALLYVEKSATHETVNVYTVNKFNYNKDIKITITANTAFNNTNITPNVKVYNVELSKLNNIYSASCIKVPEYSLEDLKIKVEIPIENSLLATFEKLVSDTPYLSYYIYYPIKNKTLSYIDFKNDLGIVYTLDSRVPLGGIYELENMELASDQIKYDLGISLYLSNIDGIRNVLNYNNRTDELGIDYNKYLELKNLILRFSDAVGHYNTITKASNYSILSDNNFKSVSTTTAP